MTTIEVLFWVSLVVVVLSWTICVVDCSKWPALIFFVSCILMLTFGSLADETTEYKQNQIRRCEYIVSHSGEYLIYGESNR